MLRIVEGIGGIGEVVDEGSIGAAEVSGIRYVTVLIGEATLDSGITITLVVGHERC